MTIFSIASTAILSMYGYVRDATLSSIIVTQQTSVALKHYNAQRHLTTKEKQEKTRLYEATSFCTQLTTQGVSEFATQHQFSKILHTVLQHEDTLVLQDSAVDMRELEYKVDEYWSARHLLDLKQHKEHMSTMLCDTLHTITKLSHTVSSSVQNLLYSNELSYSINGACALIERALCRCSAINTYSGQ